ncbi:MAG TPA: S-layer homology domain-containing protein [Coleofasciculaceae cyanobacterium]
MAPAFPDITNHWAKTAILALADRNVVHGFPDGSFRPDAPLTRAEFAALMYVSFPAAQPVRPAVYFPDVPKTHWAYSAITWGYERGLFSGYPEGYFQPDLLIPRMQVVSVLVTALHLPTPTKSDETLNLYFDDAAEIPNWVRWAIAAAVIDNRLVNYPEVRKFRPTPNTTRGELSALLCLALGLTEAVPRQYTPWNIGIYDIKDSVTVPFERWQGCARLMRDIQVILSDFRLYTGTIDGRYNGQTEQGLTQFCDFYGLNAMKVGLFDAAFAWSLTHADPVEFILAHAKDRQQIYSTYLAQEAGFDASKLAFLDRGIDSSPYKADIPQFPNRLSQKPDGVNVTSLGATAIQTGTNATITFDLYPARGEQPPMGSLDFLHADIQQACIGIGSFVDGMIRTHWLGKNPLQPAQLWSTTKILPLLNVVCRSNAKNPNALVKDCLVRSAGSKDGYGFYNLAVDLVSYADAIATSNSIAALFKQFSQPGDLQNWVQGITGNYNSEFQGRYGEPPLIDTPELWNQSLKTVLLNPAYSTHAGNNALSTYDLARFMSLVGWHNHLFPGAQLPSAQWSSLETVVRALATDTARYIDVAIDQLGLAAALESPVILSKLGFGRSDSRNRTELAYVAFVQFLDKRPRAKGKPALLRTLSLALLGVNANGDANTEARQLDARMAAEITEIIRRVMTQELV